MHKVSDILETLGGYVVVAEATGIPATTVHSWQRKNFVPDWRRPALLDLAASKGARLRAGDFPARPATPNKEEAA